MDIAKFDITVENKWNEQIKNVYANLQISNDQGNIIADTKTPSVDLKPLAREVLNAYWDTAGIKEGTYSGKILLYFADQKLERQLKTEIKLNSIKVEIIGAGLTAQASGVEEGTSSMRGLIGILIVLVVILIAINVWWFVYFKNRSKKKHS